MNGARHYVRGAEVIGSDFGDPARAEGEVVLPLPETQFIVL
jgi:hypothetical protein